MSELAPVGDTGLRYEIWCKESDGSDLLLGWSNAPKGFAKMVEAHPSYHSRTVLDRQEDNQIVLTETKEKKPHVSPSSLDMICRCGEQYRRVYICHERRPPGVAMLRGTGVGKGMETNFRQKIESWKDLNSEDVVGAAVAGLEEAWQSGGVELTPDEVSVGIARTKGRTTDEVATLAEIAHRNISPAYQPTAVENGFRIVLEDQPRDIVGYMDWMGYETATFDGRQTEDLGTFPQVVADLKTSSKKKSLVDTNSSVQLTCYGAAACNQLAVDSIGVRLEVAVNTKTPKTQTLAGSRDRGDFTALSHRVAAALRVIESGDFLPAIPGAWWCSPKFCGFFASCKFVNAERKDAVEL